MAQGSTAFDNHSTKSKRYVRTKGLAEYTGLSESFFNKARITGEGPTFITVGSACIYDLDAVDEWLAARVRRSTTGGAR